jgi:hypothetical protein
VEEKGKSAPSEKGITYARKGAKENEEKQSIV